MVKSQELKILFINRRPNIALLKQSACRKSSGQVARRHRLIAGSSPVRGILIHPASTAEHYVRLHGVSSAKAPTVGALSEATDCNESESVLASLTN